MLTGRLIYDDTGTITANNLVYKEEFLKTCEEFAKDLARMEKMAKRQNRLRRRRNRK